MILAVGKMAVQLHRPGASKPVNKRDLMRVAATQRLQLATNPQTYLQRNPWGLQQILEAKTPAASMPAILLTNPHHSASFQLKLMLPHNQTLRGWIDANPRQWTLVCE